MILDDSIIIGGRYVKCNFYFDGGDVYRDPSVKIDGGQLILGPHVSLNSYYYDKALKSLPELTPISYKDLPNADFVRKRIWPTD
jgi:hypothetical protein